MTYRELEIDDIPRILQVRMAAKENKLADAKLFNYNDCLKYITERGKGWCCIMNGIIVGFSIVDMEHSILWALFVSDEYQNKGIGSQLLKIAIEFYVKYKTTPLFLETEINTKAESFYRSHGWKEISKTHKEVTLKFNVS